MMRCNVANNSGVWRNVVCRIGEESGIHQQHKQRCEGDAKCGSKRADVHTQLFVGIGCGGVVQDQVENVDIWRACALM